MAKAVDKKTYRVVDANFNRAKEGLRVCEDIFRFFYNDQRVTREYKKLRHQLSVIIGRMTFARLLSSRDIARDIGKKTSRSEARRKSAGEIFYANSQRVKESIRVLEEFAKLMDSGGAGELKKLRYQFYTLEKNVARRYQRRFLI